MPMIINIFESALMKRTILLLLFYTLSLANTIQVLDKQSSTPLPGVNITIVGTVEGFHTDLDGNFVLEDHHRGQDLKFSYIGYADTTMNYIDLFNVQVIYLMPDVLSLSSVEVVSSKLEWEQTDLPAIVTVLRTRELIDQGVTEVKEVLERDPSVIVTENFSGEQQISIRGSNANEVMIVYDGITMNSGYKSRFDLSWLNLNDTESISIIKGSGTLRYSSGAFGGVVVIEPQKVGRSSLVLNAQRDDQKLASYSVSDVLQWGNIRTRITYSNKELMPYGTQPGSPVTSRNFLNLYAGYAFKDTSNILGVGHVNISEARASSEDYEDSYRDQYTQVRYQGDIGILPQMNIQFINRKNSSHFLNHTGTAFLNSSDAGETSNIAVVENKILSKSFVNFARIELRNDSHVSESEVYNVKWDHLTLHDIELNQTRIAATEIAKYRTSLDLPFVDFMELNASFRYDKIDLTKSHTATRDGDIYIDQVNNETFDYLSKRNGFTLNKTRKDLKYQLFYSSGTSIRYPSMYDQYLREITTIVRYQAGDLKPELNSSLEFGLQLTIQPKNKSSVMENMDVQVSRFKNRYIDKIYYRSIPRALPTPINFSATTNLTGYEMSSSIGLFNDVIRLFAGTTRLDISSYTIFPNKPKFKDIAEVEFGAKYGSVRLQYFHEGEQFYTGSLDGINYQVVELGGRENLNFYASTKIPIFGRAIIFGLSAQNLMSDVDAPYYFDQRRWILNMGVRI
ncbi:MAG: TonB-dependent receptor plug domain-containing protein [Candidatus Marinimicrobia bacterium]|jgi:outer membrane cobalamin receptor|nr:TonB-dependent receptor plug domain-containing protein [Candidatus Neomarinimicrobiota bacterium]MBT4992279.1 TonB-dependent receptor plug domain-containing protein [Candidatus Neomarinimicrobiota bacterium]MBT5466855.1 TonB-dependent receptor plug domain-containing protein [Candidatus Neomarinimicrobiota bacterium]MBT7200475.1 TonB-dependent receptor plug domain-containing protein [Candidatus Neomarinimicrobiota bacterium]MBT7578392.1 TonB-dependent receptor plug domain-containing protein [